MPPHCTSVTIVCFGGSNEEVMRAAAENELKGVVMEKEDEFDLADYLTGDEVRCVVREANPDPCLFTSVSDIRVIVMENCTYKYEGEYAIVKCSNRNTYVYFRDIFDRFRVNVIEPLLNGEEPAMHGVTLVGLPGAGKSEFAKVIANLAGATLINAYGSTIFSKWFGEPNKRVRRLVVRAIRSEPSILVINDLDSVIAFTREFSNARDSSTAYQDIVNEFLNAWDSLRGRLVTIIFTTNAPVQSIDPAMKRRFVPIVVPPPNREMMELFIREGGNEVVARAMKVFGKDKVTDFLINIISKGGTWGVAIHTLWESVSLGRFIKPIALLETFNYGLLSPEKTPELPQQLVNALKVVDVEKPVKIVLTMEGVKTEITSRVHAPFAAFLAYALGMANKRHIVVATNPDYALDAVAMAQQINGIALIPGDLRPAVYEGIANNNDTPIIFEYMTDAAQAMASRVAIKLGNPSYDIVRALYRAIADFYGVPCPSEERYGMTMLDALARYAYIVWSKRKPCYDAYTEATTLVH